MFLYYVKLARVSISKTPGLVLLMVLAIGLGIGASITTITVNYMMGANPIPHKSEQLFYVQLDSWSKEEAHTEPNDPPDQLTYNDAMALMKEKPAYRQVASSRTAQVLEPGKTAGDDTPYQAVARTTYSDFFSMFDLPFAYGQGWSHAEDESQARVAVLSDESNQRLFGGENSVGKTFRFGSEIFEVVGVLKPWSPLPRFYDLTTGAFDEPEDLYLPFTLHIQKQWQRQGNTNCWKPVGEGGYQAFLNSECVWIQFWAELRNEQEKQDYMAFLNAYTQEQKALGRFERPQNNRLSTVTEWLENQKVVADDAQLLMWLSLLFLLVCLLNTIGLMLAKFLGKSGEIGLRRALGASRNTIFTQHLVEAGVIGLLGGIAGLVIAWAGLSSLKSLYTRMDDSLMQLNMEMAVLAVALAIVSTLAAGLYPTVMASRVIPAIQLKSQ